MKKVLFVIDSLSCGGAEKSLVSLLPLLDYSALEVDLMIVTRGGVFERLIPPRVHVVPLPKASPGLVRYRQILLSLRIRALRLFGIRRHGAETYWKKMSSAHPAPERDYDVAVAYQQGFPTYYVAEKVRAKRKWAWVNADLNKAGYRPRFNRPFYERMTGVCAVSDALADLIASDGFAPPDKIRVIKDILNEDLIRTMADDALESIRTSASLKILTVGRLVSPKNYPLAVETAALLREKGIVFSWMFVGEGSERERIETLIKQNGLQKQIILAGLQPNPYPFFKACDIYVQTSSFEGFGLTLSEAKILHKPIVTTNLPSAFDQITDGETGLIAEMTPASLADNIIKLAQNPALRMRLIRGTEKEVNRTAETESLKVNQLLTTGRKSAPSPVAIRTTTVPAYRPMLWRSICRNKVMMCK